MRTIESLREAAAALSKSAIPRAERTWGGADIVVTTSPPDPPKEPSFYGEPRYVVTPRALEVSWLIERLRDAFYAEDRLDGCSKIEFFGRLANAANRCIEQGHGEDAAALCRAVLHEALAIYDEMEDGRFGSLGIASPGEILDDHTGVTDRTGYVSMDDTIEFFRKRGLEITG